ncbi:MAG: AAA family ATPase [Phycisphaerae bacterium]
MRRIAIINQKGGVGKTTTTANLGSGLARSGQRVVLLDLDPQAHLTMHFGLEPRADVPNIYQVLTSSASLEEIVKPVGENLLVAPSNIDLAAAEVELASVVGREVILRDALDEYPGKYDFMLMDCPPSLGILTINALCAANEIFITLQPHFLALQGMGKLLETINLVAKRINRDLKVSGVILCMYETGTKLANEVFADMEHFFTDARNRNLPWSATTIFKTRIRRNIKLAEAPSFGLDIFSYASGSNGAEDYAALAREVAAMTGQPAPVQIPSPAQTETGESYHGQSDQNQMANPAENNCDGVSDGVIDPDPLASPGFHAGYSGQG